jgi:hypothetical protein
MKKNAVPGLTLTAFLVAGLAVLGVRGCAGADFPAVATTAEDSVLGARPKSAGKTAFLNYDLEADDREAFAAVLRQKFNRGGVRADEAVLTFKDEAARRAFLARAAAAGLTVLGRLDALDAVRVRVGDYAAFVSELGAHADDYAEVTVNPILAANPPAAETRTARVGAPVGAGLLEALGVEGDSSRWGAGVTIAVLDGGSAADPTLGARLRYLDIGYGVVGGGEDGLHGTAVAALAAGAAADARGVAAAAEILSIRVTGVDGASDAFALAQGIFAAVDAGAEVINISLGGYATNSVLGEAVEHALAAGVAVVASSGNDQAAQLAWPAAYAGVVSVGAVDAAGRQAIFSNSGAGLQLTAPGYAVQTAGLGGTRLSFSGTSASAPVVSGAIAAVLSTSPGLTPLQAADVLTTHANDGGAAGTDPDYGNGSVNLGWALARADASRVDPALTSQSYDAARGTVTVVVQNQGAQTIAGLGLDSSTGGESLSYAVPTLAPGASIGIEVPVDRATLASAGELTVRFQVVAPAGVVDQNPANNRKTGVVTR